MSPSTISAFIAVAGLLVLVGRLVLRQALALRAARFDAAAALEDVTRLRRELSQVQQERAFMLQFLRDFPHMTRELHAGLRERAIPQLLLKVAARAFEPRGAVVMLGRRPVESEPGRLGRFVAAASLPGAAAVKIGTEVTLGEGALGYAAQAQRVMGPTEFDSIPASESLRIRTGQLPGFEPELVAPMVFGSDTLGVIGLTGASRTGEAAKAVLRLIADAGAKGLRDAVAFQDIKTTAEIDGLTGILNKRRAEQLLGEMVLDAEKRRAPVSVFLFDLDNFKHYNDTNGHLAGDSLLRALAGLVRDNLRRGDVFGRFGGEEFLVALPDTDARQALVAADKIRRAISRHPFPHAAGQPLGSISVSGGVAEYPTDGADSAALLRSADRALYAAKHAGRNRVFPADTSLDAQPQPLPAGRS